LLPNSNEIELAAIITSPVHCLTVFDIWTKQSWKNDIGICEETPVKVNALRQNSNDFFQRAIVGNGNREEGRIKFPPRNVNSRSQDVTSISLRMYTEEEVAEILQVSMSQLRKWRMKHQTGTQQGPPFKKIGRLVRYSQKALQAYIDGD
jgi:hypothetical protein